MADVRQWWQTLLEFEERPGKTAHVTHEHNLARALWNIEDWTQLVRRETGRLLDEYVLAGANRLFQQLGMQVVRCQDEHGIQLWIGDQCIGVAMARGDTIPG